MDKVEKALQCLIDNGIDRDEAECVLQAIGYILLDEELFPDMKEYTVELTTTVKVKAPSPEDAIDKAYEVVSVKDLYAYIDGECYS